MLISFIIPVYNVENYLPLCLESILNQGIAPINNYEIILVEDRSTDNSLQICREYCSKFEQIYLIENEINLGPGLSRNKGISVSKGDYLFFMDSDDCLFPNALNSIISMDVLPASPDIIQFEISDHLNNPSSCNEILYKGSLAECPIVFKNLAAWSFFFKRNFVIENNFSFSNNKIGEDALFIISTLAKNPFVVIISNLVYFYRHNAESISNNTDISYIYCQFEVADRIQSILSKSGLSVDYVPLLLHGIISKFYKKQRTLQECIRFKRKMKTYEHYDTIIGQGKWYVQLIRMPLLLYCYFLIKKRK